MIIPIESSTDAKIEENTNSEEKKKKQYKIEFNKDELKKKSKLSVNEIFTTLNPFYESLAKSFEDLGEHQPASAEAEFGLKVTAEGNVFVTKGTDDATIKIRMSWQKKT